MKIHVGIFVSQMDAAEAYQELRSLNLRGREVIVLTPKTSLRELEGVPTEDAEQPGMGKAIGGVIGGGVGLFAGATIASLLLPGVGPVLAIGLGIGGAVAGAASGGAFADLMTRGLPKDEIFFYEDALRQGRTVIIVESNDDDLLSYARRIMDRNGAESLDAARDRWWIGLRDAEDSHYDDDFHAEGNEVLYRSGFTAALEPDVRGKEPSEAGPILKERFPLVYQEKWFQRGYEDAQKYYSNLYIEGNHAPGRF